jgi:hypothetical protein
MSENAMCLNNRDKRLYYPCCKRYTAWLLPPLRQCFLILNGINKFSYLRTYSFISCFNRFGFNLINTWWFYLSKLCIPMSDWGTWGLCTSGSNPFVFICMKLIALTFNNRKKIIFLIFNILCKQITLFILFQVSSLAGNSFQIYLFLYTSF